MIGKVGCTQCNGQSPLTLEQFVERSKEKHGQDKFDYSKVEKFSNMYNKVTLTCRTHQEEFRIEINSHLNGTNSCPQCNKFSRYTRKKLLSRVEQAYPTGRHIYDKTDHQEGVKNPVTITCGIDGHGDFQQSLDAHLAGKQGCKKCTFNGTSAQERQVGDFLDSLGISYESNNRKILNGKELDFYIPENKVAIEFNGVYWHQEKFKGKNFHSQKYWDCYDQGIQLLTIWEDDWMNKPDVIQRHIAHILSRSNEERVFARRTHTGVVGKSQAQDFHSLHHIQGYVNSSVHYALRKDDGTIVALMSLLKTRNAGEWILTRYSTSVHVVGGHSKLLKRFTADHSPKKITTFADLSFSNGDLYDKTGWMKDRLLDPDYHYVIGGVLRQHKFGFRKKRFENDPDLLFDPDMTEAQLAELNNIGKIWDCGKIRYVMTF